MRTTTSWALAITIATAVVPLEAVIRDITAVTPGLDPDAGAILNATVTFKVSLDQSVMENGWV